MPTLLLAVTGMSPQVITETLYAMHMAGKGWPDGIRLITTTLGAQRAWQGLVENGQLQRLAHELGVPPLPFAQGDILVVPNAAGEPVVDARSEADHEAMADFITNVVRELTSHDALAIHASIAGGRKTMTFYLGYAMSLFGRHQDSLSHVLVNEPFENRSDFFFPTREPCPLQPRPNEATGPDASKAEVTLADIPFVRLRNQLPALVMDDLGVRVSYRRLMNLINLGDCPRQVQLVLHARHKTLRVCNTAGDPELKVEIVFPNLMLWAFYLVLAEATLEGDDSYNRPTDPKEAEMLARMVFRQLFALLNISRGTLRSSQEMARELLENDRYLPLLEPGLLPAKMLEPYASQGCGLKKETFSNYVNRIAALLGTVLPANLQTLLRPRPALDQDSGPEGRASLHSKGAGYGIWLPVPSKQLTIDWSE